VVDGIGVWHSDVILAPIRNKRDNITFLMKTLKIMITNQKITESQAIGQIVLVVSKMSRLFYFSKDKYFSVNFPFAATETEEGLIYSSKYVSDIDSGITSQVLSVVSSEDSFNTDCIFEFADPIATIVDYNLNFWSFLRELLLYEDGYIRYDYDEKHQDGLLHPLNHYDIFYSSGATFKIGLKQRIERETIIDLLRIGSNCHFLRTINTHPPVIGDFT